MKVPNLRHSIRTLSLSSREKRERIDPPPKRHPPQHCCPRYANKSDTPNGSRNVHVQILESSWSAFSSSARTPAILCLGLGSPSASLNARIQLAFLTETCKRLKVAHDAISIYDPIFTTEDIALLEEELQMRVLPKNRSREREDYILSVPTICFMPHCDIELYDTVLRANWSRDGLSNLFLLGNQLQEYLDNKPTTVLEAVAPCLLRVAPFLENQRLPISDAWPTAFNNISAQYFPSSQSSSIDKLVALWRPHPHEEEGGTGDAVGEGN
ncbi:hypothetical protein GALMADRAFT_240074 [Galerina marginata CBS 339.88]|uniref:SRR1-like domain-containing protein n=1 Tax=Galerina marginata (strain CBS 339.88) TaxID=685588 RepID=A0A067TF30_GALM3|nr:hypothetical protein GALMADRAFT_240074 [Galerina marginata CBS 339.88]